MNFAHMLGRGLAEVRNLFSRATPAAASDWNSSHTFWNNPEYLERTWNGSGYTPVPDPDSEDGCCGGCTNGCWSE